MSVAERRLAVDPRRAAPDVGLGDADPIASGLLLAVLTGLQAADVPCCYWKSGAKLRRALSGRSDLDLLVSRTARDSLFAVLQAHRFKAWPEVEALRQPGSVSFLGYDEASGQILHVHVHFRLILGDTLAKNVRIPIEEQLISRSRVHPDYPIRTLDPCDEMLVSRLRVALEGGWLDLLAWKRRLASRDREPSADASDFRELQARAELFLSPRCARLLAPCDAERGRAVRALRRAMRWETRGWRIHGPLRNGLMLVSHSIFLVLAVLNRRFLSRPAFARRPAPAGGVLIAFAGVDGSGKSTQVRQASQWLASELDVSTQYFGSGDGRASLLFRPIKFVAEAIGSRLRVKPKGASHGRVSDRPPGPVYSILFAIWAIAVALDKRAKLAATRRAVNRGFVVVTDRYPQNEIVDYNDGPLLHRLPRAPLWLRQFERSIYESAERTPPDLVIKLHVGAATVAKREPDMRAELIASRIEALKTLSFGGANCVSLDAAQPLRDVSEKVRRLIWDAL